MRNRALFFALALTSALFNGALEARPVILRTEDSVRVTADQMSWFVERDSFDALRMAEQLPRENVGTFSPGYQTRPHWLMLDVENTTRSTQILEIANPLIDRIDLYVIRDGTALDWRESGRLRSLQTRELRHHNFLFTIRPEFGRFFTILIRVESAEWIQLPIIFHNPAALQRRDRQEGYFVGAFFGLLSVLGLYHLLIFLALRERIYLLHSLFVFATSLWLLCVSGQASFLLPDSPKLVAALFPFGLAMTAASGLLLARERGRNAGGRMAALLRALPAPVIFLGPFLVLVLLPLSYLAASVTSRLLIILTLVFGLLSSVGPNRSLRERPNLLQFIAWAFTTLYVLLLFLMEIGAPARSSFSEMLVAATCGGAMITFLLASADRLSSIRDRLRFFNRELEARVQERTYQLEGVIADLTKKETALESELDTARNIQRGLLPPGYQEIGPVAIASFAETLEPVGGDYIDVFDYGDGKVGVLVADASGHGLPAALITTMARIYFLEATRQKASARGVLLYANESLNRILKSFHYVTAIFAIIDGNRFTLSSAGHRAGLLYSRRTGRVSTVDTDGAMLGMYAGDDPVTATMGEVEQLTEPGDRLLLYTDGMSDQEDPEGMFLGPERLMQMLVETADQDIRMARDSIRAGWESHGNGMIDDASFLLIEWKS